MQYNAIAPFLVETHLKIKRVLDGDSITVVSIFGSKEKEIRLYGIDCPENKWNKKLRVDEQKAQLPGEMLIQLGRMATDFVLTIAPPGTSVTLLTEKKYQYDFYKRQLAYVILPDGSCLNEQIVGAGYAKVESEYYCERLADYEQLNFAAKAAGTGLYSLVERF